MSDVTPLPPPPPARLLPFAPAGDAPLVVVVAIIMALAAMSAIAARTTWDATAAWMTQLHGALTIQVAPGEGETPAEAGARAARVAIGAPGVRAARALSQRELEDLVAPWFGGGDLIAELPLAGLADVTVDPVAPITADELSAALTAAGVDAVVDDHARWSGQLDTAADAVRALSLVVLAMLAAAAVAVTIYATRASMAHRRDVVEALHLFGAHDGYISSLFLGRFVMVGLAAGAAGAVAAGLAAGGFQLLSARSGVADIDYIPHFEMTVRDGFILAATPALAALIAGATAGRTARRTLRDLY